MKKQNLLIVHGGAPTAVMNASLYGVIDEAKKNPKVGKILGAIGGSKAIIEEKFYDLSTISDHKLQLLVQTPASAIGTSRDHLTPEDYEKMVDVFIKNDIAYVLVNGGNGSMDTCGKIKKACGDKDIFIMGVPKTIDNDISVTDHSPGYGSAARYIAATVSEICQDVRALPIHVCVVEAMGRNAGWIAAASALARADGCGPDLIYLPERPFDEDAFLTDVERLYKEKGGVVVVACEGVKDKAGNPIVKPIFEVDRSVYYGDVSTELSSMVIQKLGIKARNEKPGICGRASIAFQSEVDRDEAVIAGREAVIAALSGKSGFMTGFKRQNASAYHCENILIPIEDVMLHERVLPDAFIDESGHDVTPAFIDWCKPLIGAPLREFFSL